MLLHCNTFHDIFAGIQGNNLSSHTPEYAAYNYLCIINYSIARKQEKQPCIRYILNRYFNSVKKILDVRTAASCSATSLSNSVF